MKRDGISIIYISHRFDELREIGDRITVLRDGKSITTLSMDDFDYDSIVKLMVGRTIGNMFDCTHQVTDQEVLRLEGVKFLPNTKPVDLVVNRGEIVGLGGLVGSGRSELARSVFGDRPVFGGRVIYKGRDYTNASPSRSIAMGMAYLSEDRKIDGLIVDKNIKAKISRWHRCRGFSKIMLSM